MARVSSKRKFLKISASEISAQLLEFFCIAGFFCYLLQLQLLLISAALHRTAASNCGCLSCCVAALVSACATAEAAYACCSFFLFLPAALPKLSF
ncbi:hypothetical protein M9H77_31768 [Catharanthus roseus]|uniref:Uncharacterized protein n=1 Tax=Catharanthus roseus TaxID=4058 RepID=A0ACC0A1D7_CATRO|nr:hypothetical protein M9H77_31768 [Catharanthus roseus]